jgi:hypothetical protein
MDMARNTLNKGKRGEIIKKFDYIDRAKPKTIDITDRHDITEYIVES